MESSQANHMVFARVASLFYLLCMVVASSGCSFYTLFNQYKDPQTFTESLPDNPPNQYTGSGFESSIVSIHEFNKSVNNEIGKKIEVGTQLRADLLVLNGLILGVTGFGAHTDVAFGLSLVSAQIFALGSPDGLSSEVAILGAMLEAGSCTQETVLGAALLYEKVHQDFEDAEEDLKEIEEGEYNESQKSVRDSIKQYKALKDHAIGRAVFASLNLRVELQKRLASNVIGRIPQPRRSSEFRSLVAASNGADDGGEEEPPGDPEISGADVNWSSLSDQLAAEVSDLEAAYEEYLKGLEGCVGVDSANGSSSNETEE